MSYQQVIYPQQNSAVKSFPIDNELILFNNNSKQLALLNHTASEVWNLHEKEFKLDGIIEQISNSYGISKNDIASDVKLILDEWLSLGFIGDIENYYELSEEDNLFYPICNSTLELDKLSLLHCKTFKYLDSSFSFYTSDTEINDIVLQIISHMEEVEVSSDTHVISVVKVENKYEVVKSDKVIAICNSLKEIAPIINALILNTGYQEVNSLSVFHAGAVYDGKGLVLLSGSPGSGKSTMVTALMCNGMSVFTDEVSVLTNEKKIRPAPGCIGLKEGSWDVIKYYLPKIVDLPIHLRQDKKTVKYLQPEFLPNSTQLQYGEPVATIIFPVYSQKCQTKIKKISSAEALVRLTKSGYYTKQTLNTNTVAELIAWVHDVPTYELQINNLEEAVELVSELL